MEASSIFLGCRLFSGNKIVLISINKEIEGMNFMKEVGWRGEGQLMSILTSYQIVIVSGMFKLDQKAVRGAIISMDGTTGTLK